jgi:hypothetical protein
MFINYINSKNNFPIFNFLIIAFIPKKNKLTKFTNEDSIKTHALFSNFPYFQNKHTFPHIMGHLSITTTFISFLFLFLTRHNQLVHAESPTQPPYSCDITNPHTKSYAFCNLNLPITQRAKDIVSRLTLDEKLSQLVNTAPAIPRLGIPSYQWWSEALHGVADAGKGIRLYGGSIKGATSFPQVILTSASFDSKLWYQISQVG